MATVCESLLDILAEAGVREIFGITGDALNSLVDAIRRDDRFEWITVRHEESGAFAAAAQAKLTGRLAVCAGTVGPGALHLLNGLYDAKRDYAPVLAITGQVPESEYGSSYFQEVDLERVFGDVADFNQTVRTAEQFQRQAHAAVQSALEHRGVSHLSIPVDIIGEKLPRANFRGALVVEESKEVAASQAEIQSARAAIDAAKKPLILIGDGAHGARDSVIALAERIHAPIVNSLKGADIVPYEHPLRIGGIGHLGTPQGLSALDNCDLLLMAGCDFPYRTFLPRGIDILQIDISAQHIGRRCAVTHPLVGHVKPTLDALVEQVAAVENRGFVSDINKKRVRWDARMDKKADVKRSDQLHPQSVVRNITDKADDDALFVIDVGTATVWAGRHIRFRGEQRMFGSFNHGSLGVGLPAAIGLQLSDKKRQVVAICGDGGFAMLMQDFVTAARYKLPIVVVVLNNARFGFVELEMQAHGYVRTATGLTNPDFVAFADACGGLGIGVHKPGELNAAIDQAFASDKPVLIDAHINPTELFAPAKIEASAAWGYAMGKAKELLIAPDEDIED